ncbi:MAG: hypothetical protein U0271_23875 [Polyangiaceae bacterium]
MNRPAFEPLDSQAEPRPTQQGQAGQPANLLQGGYPVQGGYPGQQYPSQQYPNQQYPNQQYPNQQYPNQQYPNQQYPNQQYPNQQYPNQQWGYPGQPGYFAPRPAPRSRAHLWIIGVVFGLVVAFSVAGLAIWQFLDTKPQVVQAKDGSFELTTPPTWSTQTTLNAAAELQVGNPRDEEYLIVLQETKTSLGRMSLDEFSDLGVEDLTHSLKTPDIGKPTPLTIHGLPARQYVVSGKYNALDVTYIVTFIEGRNHYYRVLAWTLGRLYSGKRQKLLDAIVSFKER